MHTLQGFEINYSLPYFLNNFFVIYPIVTKILGHFLGVDRGCIKLRTKITEIKQTNKFGNPIVFSINVYGQSDS